MLKALAEIHPRPEWPFPIIVGTSAGAVSASILAANVTRWHQSVVEIENVWANFRVAPGVPLRRARHAQGRRALDGFAVHGRHDRAAEIAARQFTAARAAVQGNGFRRDPRQRGARRPARARAVRHQLFHRAFGLVLRGRHDHQRMVARAASRRARAAVARLPDGQPRHSIPVSADAACTANISATARCARPRRCRPAIHLGRRPAAGAGRAAHASRPDPAVRRVGFAAHAGPAVRLHAGYAVQRPDLRRPREPEPHQPAVGAGRRRHRHAADPHHDDRARASILRSSRSGTSTRCP